MKLDVIDKGILNELQLDCKQTHKQLSEKLNLSVTAIYERVKKLELNGYIKDYVALIDKDKVELPLVVFCQIKLSEHAKDHIQSFEEEIKALKEVSECYHLSGEYDYLIKVYIKNMEEFRQFLVTKLTAIKHIAHTQTSFTIHEVKATTAIHLSK